MFIKKILEIQKEFFLVLFCASKSNHFFIFQISAETGDQYRYGDMWQKVRNLASSLSRLGLERNTTLALVSPNCPEFVIAFLACVATGATVTTVNCLYTAGMPTVTIICLS